MVKFFYLGLLALVAVTSAEELKQGKCDPEAHAEVIQGCLSACGNDTDAGSCQLNGKPYCACEKPPKPYTHDGKYKCFTLVDDTEELMPGDTYVGQECRDRCPTGQELATYVCRKDKGESIVCVCSAPRFPVSQDNTNMRLGGLSLDKLVDTLTTIIGRALDSLDGALDKLATIVKDVLATIEAVSKIVADFLTTLAA